MTEPVQPLWDLLASKRRIAIVPALNEAATVGRVIQEIRKVDPAFEIVVVDDGSEDETGAVAEAAGATMLRLPFNLGIGGAVQTGYRYALANGFDIAVQIDGDGQHDPDAAPRHPRAARHRGSGHRHRLAVRRRRELQGGDAPAARSAHVGRGSSR